MKIYFMQKLRLKIFQVTIKADYVVIKKTEKLEIVSSFDNFVFISLKLWGGGEISTSYFVRGVISGVQIMI